LDVSGRSHIQKSECYPALEGLGLGLDLVLALAAKIINIEMPKAITQRRSDAEWLPQTLAQERIV